MQRRSSAVPRHTPGFTAGPRPGPRFTPRTFHALDSVLAFEGTSTDSLLGVIVLGVPRGRQAPPDAPPTIVDTALI